MQNLPQVVVRPVNMAAKPFPTKDEILIVFKKTMPGADWPNKTYCLVDMGNEVLFAQNTDGSHAEENMIDILKNQTLPQDVTMYINYAPCNKCAPKLINLVENNGITINIFFVKEWRGQSEGLDQLKISVQIDQFNPDDYAWEGLRDAISRLTQAPGVLSS